jgi:retron-type reverse transcriptase
VKQILEPIFEARFWHVSYGFRPGRSCHGALEHIASEPKSNPVGMGKLLPFLHRS